jgi:hypothetical protein
MTPPHPNWPPEQERGPGTPHTAPYTSDAATRGVPPGPPPGYPGAYGYPGYSGYPMQRPTNGFAVASLVLGILIIISWGFTGILALIFGYVARKQIRERGQSGDGMAIAGIVLGWVAVGIWAIILIIWMIYSVFGVGTR